MNKLRKMVFEGMDDQIEIDNLRADEVIYSTDEFAVYIKKYPAYLHQNGSAICSVVKGTENSYIVYTDSIYDILPMDMKRAAIFHEIGHIEAGYIDKITKEAEEKYKKGETVNIERDISEEIKADFLACTMVGFKPMMDLITFVLDNHIVCGEFKKETEIRLAAIKAYMEGKEIYNIHSPFYLYSLF